MIYSKRSFFHRVVAVVAASIGALVILSGVAGAAFPAIHGTRLPLRQHQ
jgi:hypothetical protein